MDIPALGEENPAKNLVENDKKIEDGACPNWREKKEFEKVLKKWFESVKSDFKKSLFMIFDWSKICLDWSKQTEAHIKF